MRIILVLMILYCLISFGCVAEKIDIVLLETQLQSGQKAVSDAEALNAEQLAADEYGRAMKLLRYAKQAQENGDIAKSMEFANQAELVAKIALYQAKQQQIREQMATVREQMYQELISEREYEYDLQKVLNEIKTEEYEQALKEIQEEKQRAGSLSTDLTETKDVLRRAEIRIPLTGSELLVTFAKQVYPDIEETADYERVQSTIARATSHLQRKEFTEAEKAALESKTQADNLFEQALQKQKLRFAAETSSLIAIERADVKIKHAESLNADIHAPEPYKKAQTQLVGARNAHKDNNFKVASQMAEEAEQTANTVISTSEVAEFRIRAKKELDEKITRAKNAVVSLKEAVTQNINTRVPKLAPQLYELATAALVNAETALANKEYTAAEEAALQGNDYLQRAIQKTEQHDTDQAALVEATKQIPKAAIIERETGVLIRISGNLFATTSTRLREEYFPTFTKLAEILKQEQFKDYAAEIEGHTDSLGAAGANKVLTEKRANSVKTYLINKGNVSESRLTAVGHGETQLIDEDSQEKNRRIDIIIFRPE
ncbi:OmpA family protein [Candidatus Poribacteria bacterium]|nr:OmpA family protein [Candidatus Poribacteria bacterium]MYF55204.1 OmpA family protein [Candidatus Poribacteria bacterium]MYI95089.1 OmpA family protein [Candidatus Poribacteria bacterium]